MLVILVFLLVGVSGELEHSTSCYLKTMLSNLFPLQKNFCITTYVDFIFGNNPAIDCNKLNVSSVALPPTIRSYGDDLTEGCKYVTVIFFAPLSIPTQSFLYWLVVNINPKAISKGWSGRSGNVKAVYVAPILTDEVQKYTFFLLCQKDKIDNTPVNAVERLKFNVTRFQQRSEFKSPEPIGCNYFHLEGLLPPLLPLNLFGLPLPVNVSALPDTVNLPLLPPVDLPPVKLPVLSPKSSSGVSQVVSNGLPHLKK